MEGAVCYYIVVAVYTWEPLWHRKRILFHCDNSTHASKTMALECFLYFAAARH